jgi:hypothetical protein
MGRNTAAERHEMSIAYRALRRAVLGALGAVIMLALGPLSIAAAESEATLAILAPLDASATFETTPTFSGTSNGTFNLVTLTVYPGESASGTPVREVLTTVSLEGAWLAEPASLAPGVYTAVATEQTETAETSTSAPITFTIEATPVVTANPNAQAVKAGEEAVFTATASGTPTPTVQWQVSTDGGTNWSDDVSDSGATTDTLTIASTSAGENGNKYRAVFTNTHGSVPSAAASLEVRTAPVVTENPAAQVVKVGEQATFTAAASGVPTPTVQWQVSTNGGSSWSNDLSDSGATTGTLTIASASAGQNGNRYRALFTNAVKSVPSAAASLEVQTAPVVTKNPTNQGVIAGETVAFTATATGVPTPEVQWQVSTNFGESWESDLSDAGNTTGKLTVVSSLALNGYEYRALFKNAVNATPSLAATLTVSERKIAPEVTGNPSSQTVTAGQPAIFTATAAGVPTPGVRWELSKDAGVHWTEDTGDTGQGTGTLVVQKAAPAQSGYEYRATFFNSQGHATSAPATLTVNTPPVVTHSPTSVSVTAGKPATFGAAASGSPTPTVQWQVSTNGGSTWSDDVSDSGATTGTLTIVSTNAGENGNEYRAVFTNAAGTKESSAASLEVRTAPAITGSPTSKAVKAGEPGVFTATASGVPTPGVQWEVLKGTGSEWEMDTIDAGNKTGTLVVEATTLDESGYQYRAAFVNSGGSVKSAAATLTVGTLAVTRDPANTSVTAGEVATFTAAASGTPPPEVTWQESTDSGTTWATVTGATTDTFTIENVQLSSSGHEYRAVFRNITGEAPSQAATLTVSAPPLPPAPPVAAFTWFPASPHTGEPVSLASTSTDAASAITAYAWDVAGIGPFLPGGSVLSTSFATPGNHAVRLSVSDAAGQSSVVTETIAVSPAQFTLMQPFPIVRIAGSDNAYGARLSLLSVQAPVGARVTIACKGRGCPAKPESRLASSSAGHAGVVLLTFPRYQRALRAGVVLQIRVSKAGQIGKYTSFTIRRSKLPVRVDMCLAPTTSKPMRCPSS